MSQLEISIYAKDSKKPDKQIAMPLSVLRLNPKLLPASIIKVLQSQGVTVAELASLEGVVGTVLDIAGSKSRIVVEMKGDQQGAKKSPVPKADTVEIPIQAPSPNSAPPPTPPPPKKRPPPKKALSPFQQRLTTEFIATELGWRTGHDLIYAACVHLYLVQGKTDVDQDQIDHEIREVSSYYKPFYSTNIKEYLQYLMRKDKLFLKGGQYSLTPSTIKYLADRLSEEKIKKRL